MKKLFTALLLAAIIFPTDAYAKVGDTAGVYYSTDIVTYLNSVEIDAINIGGETLISAEDMQYYSFLVNWSNTERTLRINSVPNATNGRPPAVKKPSTEFFRIIGNYYETDIVTYLDDRPITAYNIGGRTYIHAEEMQKFGYEVVWDGNARTLNITSPDRAGYVYDIFLTQGKVQTTDGTGAFSINYTPQKTTATGDAEYFTTELHSLPAQYSLDLKFYQNEGLFKSEKLLELLNSLCTDIPNPDAINQNLRITVNGHTAKTVSVEKFQGNGHIDYSFIITDLPKFTKDKIKEITVSVGEPSDAKEFEIFVPESDSRKLSEVAKSYLTKYGNDYIKTFYQTDEYFAVYMHESQYLGEINAHHLYLVNRKTWECSDDILEQVRTFDGFNYEILNPFDFKAGDTKNNLFFACDTPGKSGSFYVEMNSATVHLISERNK